MRRLILLLCLGLQSVDASEPITLTLDQAIAQGLRNNPDIQISRIDPKIENARTILADSAFGTEFRSSYLYEDIRRPQNTQEFVATGGDSDGLGTEDADASAIASQAAEAARSAQAAQIQAAEAAQGSQTTSSLATADVAASSGGDSVNSGSSISSVDLSSGDQSVRVDPRIFNELNHRGEASLSKRLVNGATVEVGSSVYSLDNTLNRQLPPSLFNPEYGSFTGVSLTQPLLRGFGKKINSAEIRVSKSNARLANYEFEATVSNVIGGVTKRYYDLVYAYQQMLVTEASVAVAEQLVKEAREREKEGQVSKTQVLQAMAAAAAREEEAFSAYSFYIERQNALRLVIQNEADALEEMEIVPVDGLPDRKAVPDRETLISLAFDNRIELRQADELVAQREIRVEFAKGELKPQLDIQLNAGLHGLAESFDESYNRAFDQQGPEWSAGFVFSSPLDKSGPRSQVTIAQLEKRKAMLALRQQRITVALEVDTVLRRLESNFQRIETSRQASELAVEALEDERLRLGEGLTTQLQVSELESRAYIARVREIEASADLSKAYVDIALVGGTMLEERKIVIETENPDKFAKKAAPKAQREAVRQELIAQAVPPQEDAVIVSTFPEVEEFEETPPRRRGPFARLFGRDKSDSSVPSQ